MNFTALKNLIRPSGGLYYHGRALLNQRRWRGFQDDVRGWLANWPCDFSQELILIGPSAGYTLPKEWLKKFPKLVAFDLDPLAPSLFRWRHRDAEFHGVNLFWSEGRLSLNPLCEILLKHPHANILFCNVLGQVLLEGHANEDEWRGFLHNLRQRLRGRCWASYHDVKSRIGNEVVDHLTENWAEDLSPRRMNWPLAHAKVHELHGVWEKT